MSLLPARPHWELPGASLPRALRFFAADYPSALRLRFGGSATVPAEWASGTRAPVVLIPGVYQPWWYLRPIGEQLNRLGHPVIPVPTLERNTRRIDATAALVGAVLVALDLRGVVVVAHSKGGIVGKHLMAHGDPDHRVSRLVAIATPFRGSGMASFFPGRALKEFRTSDPELLALQGRRDLDARITSVYPVFDPHIPEGSRLPGARNVPLRMGGHFGMLLSPDAIQVIVREVARAA